VTDDETHADNSAETLELAPESKLFEGEPEEVRKGFWKKLKRGLFMTHNEILDRVGAAVSGRATLDEESLEALEEALIGADLGVETALELVESIRRDPPRGGAGDLVSLKERLVDEMSVLLLDAPQSSETVSGPTVTLVVGVNGVGKTTTIAKLARLSQKRGERVLLVAGDTFRAAAIEQLETWGERVGVGVVRQSAGADPAAVVYDGLQAARARHVDHVLVDTAGRLHTKEHLMRELGKMRRVIDKEAGDWHQRTLLILDATTGQNAIAQARRFKDVVEVDGAVLTKVDGTAKGGMAVAVARELRLPILYLGVGETPEDLVPFRAREFAAALLG